MQNPLSPEQAQAYIKRWRLVNNAEIEELKNTSYAEKFTQLTSLMASVKPMGWDSVLTENVDSVRSRWVRLRNAFKGA